MKKSLFGIVTLFFVCLTASSVVTGCHTQAQGTLPSSTNSMHHEVITPVAVNLPPVPNITLPPLDPDAGLDLSNAGQNGETITPLRTGQRAPYNGVLFNGPAVAYLQVAYHTQAQRCLIDRQHDMDLALARYNADTATLRLALATQVRTDQVILNGRDQDIASLTRVVNQQSHSGPDFTTIVISGGVGLVVGAVAVGILALSLH